MNNNTYSRLFKICLDEITHYNTAIYVCSMCIPIVCVHLEDMYEKIEKLTDDCWR